MLLHEGIKLHEYKIVRAFLHGLNCYYFSLIVYFIVAVTPNPQLWFVTYLFIFKLVNLLFLLSLLPLTLTLGRYFFNYIIFFFINIIISYDFFIFTITITPKLYPRLCFFLLIYSLAFFKIYFLFFYSRAKKTLRARQTLGAKLSWCNFVSSCKFFFVQKYLREVVYPCAIFLHAIQKQPIAILTLFDI